MALDPSIALNPNRPPPVDMYAGMERGMNLAALAMKPAQMQQQILQSQQAVKASQAEEANLIAQRMGLEAESKKKEREFRFAEWMSKPEQADLIDTSTGALNVKQFLPRAIGAGFADQTGPHLKQDIENTQGQIKTAGDQAQTQSLQVKAIGDVGTYFGNYLSDAPKGKEWQVAKQVADRFSEIIPGVGDKLLHAVMQIGPTGEPILDRGGKPMIDMDKVITMSNAGITPKDKETLVQSALTNNITKESRLRDSDESNQFRDMLIRRGFSPKDVNDSKAVLMQREDVKQLLSNAVQSRESRERGYQGAAKDFEDATYVANLKIEVKKLVDSGKLPKGNMTEQYLINLKNRFKNDSASLAVVEQLQRLATKHGFSLSTFDGPTVTTQLDALFKNLMNGGMMKESNAGRVSNAQPLARPPQVAPPVKSEVVSRKEYEAAVTKGMKENGLVRQAAEAVIMKKYPNLVIKD